MKAEAAAVARPAPASTVPAARLLAAAAAVTARVATAGEARFSLMPPALGVRVGSPYRSHLLSKHILLILSLWASQRQLTGSSCPCFADWQSRFSFSVMHANDTRACSSGCPCSFSSAFHEPVRPRPLRHFIYRPAHQTLRHFVGESD